MILYSHNKKSTTRKTQGMSLVEVMIATTLMLLVVVFGMLSANYIGMKEDQLIESKAGASDTSRQAINDLLQDIRSAKGYVVGSMSGTTFTPYTDDVLQAGPGLMLYPIVINTNQTIDTTKYILYYYDLRNTNNSDGHLVRFINTNGTTTSTTIIASNLINSPYSIYCFNFASEDYTGTIQTNRTYKGVIHTTLQFAQFYYPLTKVGSNYLYDYYRIECRATPHLPDGP